jgi:hypothetical protein
MPRYHFDVRHLEDGDYLEDNPAGVELPDDAAAREFALNVMRGLADSLDEDWTGWTMEVTEGGRPVWRLPFDAMKLRKPLVN